MNKIILALLVALSGCSTMSDRPANVRHPCGNIWDICRGDSVIVDKVNDVFGGRN